ncbi:MAG: hypothetical protein KatS3mg109_0730 [Pirellulaceae bacterium]|nr:MAG: hypothetical protein KatS3mg109_0730 [Pirellulaceae bacterium]
MQLPYDAILLVAFGGPEGPDEVMPFLENVLRGRRVPRQRIEEVAAHYFHFGGVSPINAQCRELIEALQSAMQARSWRLPVYWGNRNWHPLLEDTLRRMAEDGVQRAVAVITSAYSSYSSCRQYLENIEAARKAVGHLAPTVDRIRPYFNHPAFVEAWTERLAETLQRLPDTKSERWHVLFTAHSIPLAMAERCDYERQLRDVATCLSERLNIPRWNLVYQSRSGPPEQPWLEPDVCDFVRQTLTKSAISHVVVAPIGFLSDHMEVLVRSGCRAQAGV